MHCETLLRLSIEAVNWGVTVDPPAEWGNINGGWHSELGVEPPRNSHPDSDTLNTETAADESNFITRLHYKDVC